MSLPAEQLGSMQIPLRSRNIYTENPRTRQSVRGEREAWAKQEKRAGNNPVQHREMQHKAWLCSGTSDPSSASRALSSAQGQGWAGTDPRACPGLCVCPRSLCVLGSERLDEFRDAGLGSAVLGWDEMGSCVQIAQYQSPTNPLKAAWRKQARPRSVIKTDHLFQETSNLTLI